MDDCASDPDPPTEAELEVVFSTWLFSWARFRDPLPLFCLSTCLEVVFVIVTWHSSEVFLCLVADDEMLELCVDVTCLEYAAAVVNSTLLLLEDDFDPEEVVLWGRDAPEDVPAGILDRLDMM